MKPSIEQAATAFQEWRSTRSNRGRTPKNLKTQAVSLLGRYPIVEICRELNINSRSLTLWAGEEPDQPQEFATLRAESMSPSTEKRDIWVRLVAPGGVECEVCGEFEAPFIASLLRLIHQEVA